MIANPAVVGRGSVCECRIETDDANQAEVAINESFLHPIRSAFVDLLAEAIKFERLNDRGPMFKIANLDFPFPRATFLPVDIFNPLTLQRRRVTHMNTCPCPFCDEMIEPRSMDMHIEFMHGEKFHLGLL
jgi:hypothetical protein